MITAAQNRYNDFYVDADTHQLAIATQATAQAFILSDAIRTCLGEIQLNTSLGIPYFSTVFSSVTQLSIFKYYVTKRILEFDFVLNIDDFSLSYDSETKQLDYTIKVTTDIDTVTITPTNNSATGDIGDMSSLVQNGEFYLPVYLDTNDLQVYRKLTQYIDPDTGVTTQISDEEYIKSPISGMFVIRT